MKLFFFFFAFFVLSLYLCSAGGNQVAFTHPLSRFVMSCLLGHPLKTRSPKPQDCILTTTAAPWSIALVSIVILYLSLELTFSYHFRKHFSCTYTTHAMIKIFLCASNINTFHAFFLHDMLIYTQMASTCMMPISNCTN